MKIKHRCGFGEFITEGSVSGPGSIILRLNQVIAPPANLKQPSNLKGTFNSSTILPHHTHPLQGIRFYLCTSSIAKQL